MRYSINQRLIPVLTAATLIIGPVMAGQVPQSAVTSAQVSPSTDVSAPNRFGGHVHALVVNPRTKELFLGARPIYRSADNGKSWAAINGIPESEVRANITSIAIDPIEPQVMYATGHGVGVVKSADAGKTWKSENSGLGGLSTEGFAIDRRDPNMLYVWVLGTGLYRSKDAASSWQRVDDGPSKQEIRSLVSVNSATGMGGIWLYAGTDAGVIKSPDCFCGWDRLPNKGLAQGRVYSIAVDPANPKVLYAGMRQGVFKTLDSGNSWRQISDLVGDAVVTVDAADPNSVYAAGGDGTVAVSLNAGNHWAILEHDYAKK